MSKHRRSARQHAKVQQPQPSSERYKHLPEPVDPKDMVTVQQTDPPRDPEGGRDTDRDFMIRYGAGG